MYKGKRIAVCMPAYNGAEKIAGVIARTPKIYDHFIVVDDGSTDATPEILKKIKGITVIRHPQNRGYGGAQKTMYREAVKRGADFAVMLHQDGQYSPADMPALLDAAIAEQADVVLGSRILSGKQAMLDGGVPAYKYYGNRFLTAVENAAFGTKIAEFHTGYRVYSRKAINAIDLDSLTEKYYFDSDIILEALKHHLKIAQVPISVHYYENVTAANPFSYGLEILFLVAKFMLRGRRILRARQ
ncbi:MAG: glycosyltransferase family 2 protein [Candidatus Aenigmarchaeota archaeon]|nr:glycosyltransferase family 2 protein [Candidatus Aenigmarchaeota archaeon]